MPTAKTNLGSGFVNTAADSVSEAPNNVNTRASNAARQYRPRALRLFTRSLTIVLPLLTVACLFWPGTVAVLAPMAIALALAGCAALVYDVVQDV